MMKSIIKCKGFFGSVTETKKSFAKYSVVSACYNVSSYLEEYFESMVRQTIGFNNVFLIMVDDGSTDDTAVIIKKWVNRYPENISYVFQENGGQVSARNLGLKFVKTPWVTFTDPDDFLDDNFFLNVDVFLSKNNKRNNISLIASNIIFYHEKDKAFKNNHPLMHKFTNPETVLQAVNLKDYVQLSAASCFFNVKLLQKHGIVFPDIRPNFEDGSFILSLLMSAQTSDVAFLRDSKYYYRKREYKSSTLDKAWSNPGHYLDVFEKGYIPILRRSQGQPVFETVQYAVLYDIVWHIKNLVNRPEAADFLTDEQKAQYLDYMDQCFSFISKDLIYKFNLCKVWYYHKVGMVYCFKHEVMPVMFVYAEKYDPVKDEVLIRYFSGNRPVEQFLINGREAFPTHIKWIKDDFLTRVFVRQRLVWLPLNHGGGDLEILLDGQKPTIVCKGIRKKLISLREIRSCFDTGFEVDAPWLFMDRMNKADDNAEHLYRYVMNNCPTKKDSIFFLLTRDSEDWSRLEREGFNLVEFESPRHRELSVRCNKIISSHIDMFVTDFWKDGSQDSKQIVFLQHGVTKDDLSSWLNTKKRIDLFVTATVPEYESIVRDDSRYRYTDKEVKLLGFARHDALLSNAAACRKKVIMIMPTWRASLATSRFGKVVLSDGFQESDYFRSWTGLLLSSELKELAECYGYSVLFFPHPVMKDVLRMIKLPEYICIPEASSGSIQDRFRECSVLITDYSSVGFEVGYLAKPVLYYQFDADVFWKQQVYQKGYFDYKKDGFGAVSATREELLKDLEQVLKQDCSNIPGLKEKVEATYLYRDGCCCERILNAIFDLERPNTPDATIPVILSFIKEAILAKNFDLARSRAIYLRGISPIPEHAAILALLDLRYRIDSSRLNVSRTLLDIAGKVPEAFRDLYEEFHMEYLIFTGQYEKARAMLEDPRCHILCKTSMLVWVSEKLNLSVLSEEELSSLHPLVRKIYEGYLSHEYGHVAALFEVSDDVPDVTLRALLRKVYDNCAAVKDDPWLCAIVSYSAIQCNLRSVDILMRNYLEKLTGRKHLWRSLEAFRSCRHPEECPERRIYINLALAYRRSAGFMSCEEFAEYLRVMKSLFAYKIFKNKLMRIQYEEIALIDNAAKKRKFEDMIAASLVRTVS